MEMETTTVTRPITVAELGVMHWIRITGDLLDLEASEEVRQACLRALERGVSDIVIELTGVVEIGADGVDMLEAAADELRAKHGTLSLVVRHDESVGRVELRHVPPTGLAGLVGLSRALDDALLEGRRMHEPDATEERGR